MTQLKPFTDLDKLGHRPAPELVEGAPGTCPECATVHPPEQPHARQSLFYQYRYCQQHGRFPSWNDAMAHCTPAIQRQWREGLRECGVDVPEPEVAP